MTRLLVYILFAMILNIPMQAQTNNIGGEYNPELGIIETNDKSYWIDLFNDVIGSNSSNPNAKCLDGIEYDGGVEETIDSFQIDTNMQLFRDYMGVDIGNGIIIDLHHLFVGLDVLNHFYLNKTPSDLRLILLKILGSAPSHFGNNIDTATWAGDLGSIAPDLLYGADKDFRNFWLTNHPNASEEDKYKAFFEHFYNTRASDIDMISDAIVHRIHKTQNRYLSRSNFRNIVSLLYFDFLMIHQDGLKPSFAVFLNYLGLNTAKTFDPDDKKFEQQNVETQMLGAIQLFSLWWRAKNNAVSAIFGSPSFDELLTYNKIITKRYLKWLNKYR